MPQPYLIELNSRLAKALANSPAGQADACARFVLAHRRADGGFTGRAGPADLYYTAFALRILALLGRLDSDVRTTAAAFAASQPAATLVDLVSQLFAACMTADLAHVRKAGRSHAAADRIE
ncbi:MAG: hypothetical protein HQ546_02445, partial [Planctomycetes bacterium]|nr:hypothetical protein [Planctomycetota bacterium]